MAEIAAIDGVSIEEARSQYVEAISPAKSLTNRSSDDFHAVYRREMLRGRNHPDRMASVSVEEVKAIFEARHGVSFPRS